MVANYGVGYDNVDLEASASRGVTVTNTPAKLDWRELYESNCFNDVSTTHISQETWVEEWLPSM